MNYDIKIRRGRTPWRHAEVSFQIKTDSRARVMAALNVADPCDWKYSEAGSLVTSDVTVLSDAQIRAIVWAADGGRMIAVKGHSKKAHAACLAAWNGTMHSGTESFGCGNSECAFA